MTTAVEDTSTSLKAIRIYRGVSIYKVSHSPNWMVRVWDTDRRKYLVKTTGTAVVTKAREIAKDLALTLLKQEKQVEREFSFKTYALKLIKQGEEMARKKERNIGYVKSMMWCIQNKDWGLLKRFGNRDVREITTRDFRDYMNYLDNQKMTLSSSTKNTILATFRNVLKIAREEAIIDVIPDTPRSRQKDNPRPFFRFHPLVSEADDVYEKLKRTAKIMADERVSVRGIEITDELYDLILFVTHSFVRPITSELYSIRHQDVTIAENPKRLILTIRDGKTGYRVSNTMEAAVWVYKRTQKRHLNYQPEDYIFLPEYKNRITAGKIIQRQFKELMSKANCNVDPFTGLKHSIYSLRHTAICMRIIHSKGQVNIFNLAKNAGTSVDQIERFYARHLPLSAEMARNLQSFGS
jgi:site-specific recombinase XerC